DHVRRLVAAAADGGRHLGELGGMPVQGLAPRARHGFVPAVAGGRGHAAAAVAGAWTVAERGMADEVVECGLVNAHGAVLLSWIGCCCAGPGPDRVRAHFTGGCLRRAPARRPTRASAPGPGCLHCPAWCPP